MSDTQLQPQAPLSVTLTAVQWDQVLRLLDEVSAPHRITAPLMAAIQQQCMQQARPQGTVGQGWMAPEPEPPRGNGIEQNAAETC